MASDNYEEKYTKPDLRREIKEEIKQSDKGGKPGQWSARKSQLLVQEYEKQGGGYKKDKKDEAAQSLEEWGEQNWQTKEGEGRARQDGTKRYLPEKVWEKLSDEEQKEAEQTKKEASQRGDQYVKWTPAIKRAMQEAGYTSNEDSELTKQELYEEAKALDVSDRSKMNKDELKQSVSKAKTPEDDRISNDLSNLNKDELYEQAKELNVSDRSKMNKDELIKAVREAK